ncbi:PH domain-containing protein [Streptacidiphilus sp. MAP5-3]|uniref:PH domain-containing protein n=1 Tax=unclassified Streptacidiphilus TaxID=2643834 RepID=UPI003515A423
MTARPSRVTGPPTLPHTWRPVLTRVVLLGLAAVSVAFFATLAILSAPDWQRHDRIGIGSSGVVFAIVLVVLARPKAKADRQGLTVVNFVRTRRLEWPQIIGVNLRQGDPWVLLDLADGGTLAVVAIQPGAGRRQAARKAKELQACVDVYGTAQR